MRIRNLLFVFADKQLTTVIDIKNKNLSFACPHENENVGVDTEVLERISLSTLIVQIRWFLRGFPYVR